MMMGQVIPLARDERNMHTCFYSTSREAASAKAQIVRGNK